MKRNVALFVVAVLLVTLTPALLAREGFGLSKKAVKLERKVPPQVLLAGDRIDVRVQDDGGYAPESRKLRDLLAETMTSYDTRLIVDGNRPEIMVELQLRDVTADENWIQKTETETRKTGTKVEYDAKGNKKEKPVYETVKIQVNHKEVRGNLEARYRVTAASGGTELHAGEARSSFKQSYRKGDGAPTRSEVRNQLIERAAREISSQLVGMQEPVSVLVPRGSFERLVPAAEQGKWNDYLQQVSSITPLKKPADEAYRQYALGVAKEALAYESSDEQKTVELLQAAAEHYRQAASMNPRESLFAKEYSNIWSGGEASSPLERVESGVSNYTKLHEQREQLAGSRNQ
jgi:hypothetical protein